MTTSVRSAPASTAKMVMPTLAPKTLTEALLQRVASSPPIARRLAALAAGDRPVFFEHITEAARSLVCGVLAANSKGRLWLVCPNVRSHETLYNELLNWIPAAHFFPEADRQ